MKKSRISAKLHLHTFRDAAGKNHSWLTKIVTT
jgi:hypothetical protein